MKWTLIRPVKEAPNTSHAHTGTHKRKDRLLLRISIPVFVVFVAALIVTASLLWRAVLLVLSAGLKVRNWWTKINNPPPKVGTIVAEGRYSRRSIQAEGPDTQRLPRREAE